MVFTCDQCGKHFTLGSDMELPPGWFGFHIAIADSDGYIPSHERDTYDHFCSIECVSEYVAGGDLKERLYLADKPDKSKDEEDE